MLWRKILSGPRPYRSPNGRIPHACSPPPGDLRYSSRIAAYEQDDPSCAVCVSLSAADPCFAPSASADRYSCKAFWLIRFPRMARFAVPRRRSYRVRAFPPAFAFRRRIQKYAPLPASAAGGCFVDALHTPAAPHPRNIYGRSAARCPASLPCHGQFRGTGGSARFPLPWQSALLAALAAAVSRSALAFLFRCWNFLRPVVYFSYAIADLRGSLLCGDFNYTTLAMALLLS